MRIYLSILFFLVVELSGLAQTVTVLNQDLKPLEAATISDESGKVWVTGKNGQVEIELSSPQNIIIQHVSHQKKIIWAEPFKNIRIVLESMVTGLSEVIVEGFGDDESLSNLAGSIAKLEPKDLNRFDNFSLVASVNTIPGVRFEERAGASYRVSIRGSSIRSPFGVRNVKVYWNGIPFTDPGGNTFLNLLDLANVGALEIIKGPAGSLYGAGNGGVMKLTSTSISSLSNATQLSSTIGSYGAQRVSLSSNTLGDKHSITAKYAFQNNDGYRDHNSMQRHTGEIDALFFPSEARTISASLLFSDIFYEIPGGLNPTQLDENRRQARPGSEAFNASIDHQLTLMKMGQEYSFSENFKNETNLYTSFRQFENPFILDYKKDEEQSFGLRSEFENRMNLGSISSKIQYGLEYQVSYFDGKNFGNAAGQADTLRFADELTNQQSILIANSTIDDSDSWKFTVGGSYNSLKYDINRLVDEISASPGRTIKTFDGVFSPRVAISKIWSPQLSTHFSISDGFSPPTATEIRTNEGTINTGLEAERGTNYEVNIRGSLLNNRLSYDLALFAFQLNESITTETNEQGVVLFRNSGQIEQNGLEASVFWNWLENESSTFEVFNSRLAFTYHDFKFKNYSDGGTNLSGNALTGTAPQTLTLITDIRMRNGFFANLTYQYSDSIPLNDENTVYAEAYQLFQSRVGYAKMGKQMHYEFYVGTDNLFNEKYSLGNDLNAFGQRYFQPAPERSFYIGLNLKFNH